MVRGPTADPCPPCTESPRGKLSCLLLSPVRCCRRVLALASIAHISSGIGDEDRASRTRSVPSRVRYAIEPVRLNGESFRSVPDPHPARFSGSPRSVGRRASAVSRLTGERADAIGTARGGRERRAARAAGFGMGTEAGGDGSDARAGGAGGSDPHT